MQVPVKRSDSWTAWSRLLVQGCDLRQWCSPGSAPLCVWNHALIVPPSTHPTPLPSSTISTVHLPTHRQWVTDRHVRPSYTTNELTRVCNSSGLGKKKLLQEVGRGAVAETFFCCSHTEHAVSWGFSERRKGRLTVRGDSVLPQQHSQKRCGSNVCVCVCMHECVYITSTIYWRWPKVVRHN